MVIWNKNLYFINIIIQNNSLLINFLNIYIFLYYINILYNINIAFIIKYVKYCTVK